MSRQPLSSRTAFASRVFVAPLLLAVLGLTASAVHAAPYPTLNPGDNGIAAVGAASPVGATLIATQTNNAVFGAINSSVTSEVWSGDTSNPYGGLDFVYYVTNNSPGEENNRLTVNGFAGFLTDVGYQTPSGAGIVPSDVDRSGLLNFGDVIGFNIFTINPGDTSAVLVIQTNATHITIGNSSVIDGASAHAPIYSPAVPEPSSLVLACLGLLGLAAVARRRSR